MIPLLAVPLVSSVVGHVVNAITPSSSSIPPFEPYLNQVHSAVQTASPQASPVVPPSGILHANEWSQMSPQEVQSLLQGLVGRHVDATGVSGRAISGVVSRVQQVGGQPALEIGKHLVSLSQLNQITWAPSAGSTI